MTIVRTSIVDLLLLLLLLLVVEPIDTLSLGGAPLPLDDMSRFASELPPAASLPSTIRNNLPVEDVQ